MGELARMACDPFSGQGFDTLGCRFGILMLAAVAFNLADLFSHACAEQSLLIGKGNADPIAICIFTAPGNIAGIAGCRAERGDVYLDGSALAPGTRVIACDAAQADSVQPLAGNAGVGALCQFNRNIIRVRQETTHAHGLRAPST